MKRLSILALATLILAGCGGGGGSDTTGPTPTPAGQSVRLFATDSVRDDFSGVWVVLRRITAVGANGETVLVDNPEGLPIDVRALGTAAGRNFRLLGAATLPAGATSLRVTVESGVLLVPSNSVAGQRASFEGSGETRDFTVALGTTNDPDVILDFDLGSWTLSGGKLTAPGGGFVRRIDDRRVDDPAHHVSEDFKGMVSGLSGTVPTQTFKLDNLTIRTTATTTVFNGNGASNPALTNGQRVEVEGALDPASNTVVATAVKIEDARHEGEAEAKGTVVSSDAAAGTLVANVFRARGFLPDSATVNVATTETTRYLSDAGTALTRDAFFAALTPNLEIEAEGTYADGTLTARALKLEDEGEHHGGGHGDHGGDD